MATQVGDVGPSPSPDKDVDGNAASPAMNLPLIIGLGAAALVVMIVIILLVLWRTGKLRKRRRNILRSGSSRKDQGNDTLREARKKSIIVVAPTNREGAELYIVRHFYRAEDDNQVTLESGRIVEVVEKMDNGWWRGIVGDQEGWFPATFVRKIDVSEPIGQVVEATDNDENNPSAGTDKGESDGSDGCYINTGYTHDLTEHRETTGDRESKAAAKKAKKAAGGKGIEHLDSIRLNGMQNEDIEGYLNEIFSVEDETTPETPRRTPKTKHHKASKNKSHTTHHSLQKKKKDLENSKKLKEQSISKKTEIENLKNAKIGKISHLKQRSLDSIDQMTSNGVKGSPLINPVHYMISSSESLISSGSYFEESEKQQSHDLPAQCKTEEVSDDKPSAEVADTSVQPAKAEEQSVSRGAPDGSSLQDVLPDRKGLTCTTVESGDVGPEGDVDTTDDSNIDKSGTKSDLSFVSNLKDHLQNHEKRVRRRSYVAMYPFTPADSSQLSLSRNDVIYALGDEKNGWIKGEKKDTKEIGWFPKDYTREGKSPPGVDLMSEESEAPDSDGEFEEVEQTGLEYRVLYPYTAQQDGDLSITEGATVIVLDTLDNGWWRGCQGDQEGWFPGTYVEPVPQTPATSGVQEVTSPFSQTGPLSTSSPIEDYIVTNEKSKRQSLPIHLEDPVVVEVQNTVLAAPPPTNASKTPFKFDTDVKSQQSKRTSMPPLSASSKPVIPQRYVTPKQVQMPKRTRHRKDSHTVNVKPSRPPPPVPKSGPGISIGSSPDKVVLRNKPNQGPVPCADTRRRESVPRPSVPPPPAPVSNTPTELPVLGSGEEDILKEAGHIQGYLEAAEDEDLIRKMKKNSLPGVHKGNSPRNSDTTETDENHTEAGDVHNFTKFTTDSFTNASVSNIDEASTVGPMAKQPADSSLSFNAIMTIFEKIADKADYSLSSQDNVDFDDADAPPQSKPQIPPKPEEEMLEFRRTKSDPDLMRLKSAAALSLPQTRKSDNCDLDLGEQGQSRAARPSSTLGSGKPALPPRPKVVPQRSRSLGSVVVSKELTLNGNTDPKTDTTGAMGNPHVKTVLSDSDRTGCNVNSETSTRSDRTHRENRQAHVKGISKVNAPEHSSVSKDITVRNNVHSDYLVHKEIKANVSKPKVNGQSGSLRSPKNLKLDILSAQKNTSKDNTPSSTPPPRPEHPPTVSPLKLKNNRTSQEVSTPFKAQQSTETPNKTIQPHEVPQPTAVHKVSPSSERQRIISNGSLRLSGSLELASSPPRSGRDMDSIHLGRGIHVVGGLIQTSPDVRRADNRTQLTSNNRYPSDSNHGNSESQEVMITSAPHPGTQYNGSRPTEDHISYNGPYPSLTSARSQIPSHRSPTTQEQAAMSSAHSEEHPPVRHVTSPLNIKTNPMRFFSPMGFSKSPSSSSVSSATTLSPLTMSPVYTDNMNPSSGDITSSGESTLKFDSDIDADPRTNPVSGLPAHSVPAGGTRSSHENLYRKTHAGSSSRSPNSDPNNSLRFYTPPGYTARPGSIGHMEGVGRLRADRQDHIPASLPTLLRYDGSSSDMGEEDPSELYRSRNIHQRNSDAAKLHKVTSSTKTMNGDHINNGHLTSYHSLLASEDRNRGSLPNGYQYRYNTAHSDLEQRPPTPARPVVTSGDHSDHRRLPLSHQLKLVALKNEDLESDV